jgi:hypothetical protein
MSHNVGGTLVASGTGVVTPYATSFNQGGWPVWGASVDVPDFTLPAGNYRFGLAIGTTAGLANFFVASTTGGCQQQHLVQDMPLRRTPGRTHRREPGQLIV